MTVKFPPPPYLTTQNPDTQRLNRWLIEIQSILNSDGSVNLGTSVALTGVPTAPNAPNGTNTTQIATTEFVLANGAGVPSTTVPLVDATPGHIGTSTAFARADHVHPTDTSRAPLASPGLTGVPTAPTAAPGTASGQLATTNFVSTAGALLAPLASPVFTGAPQAPTPALGDNSTDIATTAFVQSAVGGGGSGAGTARAWVTFTGSTGAILNSFNVASVARASPGVYTVTFAAALPSANFACVAAGDSTTSIFTAQPQTKTVNTVKIAAFTGGTTADPTTVDVVCFG
jgi:hypothetical protein